jgi:hypothetical protein
VTVLRGREAAIKSDKGTDNDKKYQLIELMMEKEV